MAATVLKLLMVEDERLDAELITRQLAQAGYAPQTRTVETELELRTALAEFSPDLILSDFSLPKFDGLSALAVARELAPGIPFIFISGTIGEARAIDALSRGASDYVLKDNLARLSPAVERTLREAEAHRARRDAEEALRTKEQRLRDIVETSQDWIWDLDANGCFVFSNSGVKQILGYRPDQILGKAQLDFVHPEDRAVIQAATQRVDSEGYGVTGVVARWQRRDGSYRWLERSLLPLMERTGKIIGHRGADRDITERKLQEEKIARLNRIHRMLSGINSAIVRIRNREELLREACRIAVEQGGYALASVYAKDPSQPVVRPLVWHGVHGEGLPAFEVPLASGDVKLDGVTARALATGQVFASNDIAADTQSLHWRKEMLDFGFRAMIALPLSVDGTAVATLNLLSTEANIFNDTEIGLLRQLAGNIAFALQYLEKEHAAHFLEYFDPLTGLAKRSLFCERLTRTMAAVAERDYPLIVLVFDVERLSAINDSLGRHAGDQLLQLVVERMRSLFKDTNTMAHLTGGTFAIMFSGLVDAEDAAYMLRTEIARLFAAPFSVDGQELHLAAKSGIAHHPQDGRDAEVLLNNAEAALREAKEAGEKYLHYRLHMNAQVAERLALENRLQRALESDQFVLHYQPLISLVDGRVEGVEALLRWQDPETGLVPPTQFIPILETTGMIVDVGAWAIRQAATDCLAWRGDGKAPLRVAVNVAPLQLRHREFVDSVLAVLETDSANGVQLDLEITEGMLMTDLEQTTRKLRRLRAAGVRIELDDFGTGYSSLSRLAKLPIDTIKIDRSFINDLVTDANGRTIVATIIALARAFGMATVAEGVETREQLAMLKTMHCDQIQGYLVAKPMPALQLQAFLQQTGGRFSVQ